MRFSFELLGAVMNPPFTHRDPGVTGAVVEAADVEPLNEVYQRAADALGIGVYSGASAGVSEMVAFVQFATAEEAVYDKRQHLRARDLEIVDADGTISFARTLSNTTVADLIRTSEAGLLPGEPARPYFIAQVPAGGAEPWLLTLQGLVVAYGIVRTVITLAADVDGALSFIERVRRVRAGSEALSVHAEAIGARNGRPDALYELLGRRPWMPADLALRLGLDLEAARAILELFGFEESGSGLWRRGTSADAEFLRAVLDEVVISASTETGGHGASFENRIRRLVDDGLNVPRPTPLTQSPDDESDGEGGAGVRKGRSSPPAATNATAPDHPSFAGLGSSSAGATTKTQQTRTDLRYPRDVPALSSSRCSRPGRSGD